jgi:antitoxin CcdA
MWSYSMPPQTATKKKAINVSIDPALAAEAKAAGLNVSSVLEAALNAELKAVREAQWKVENKAAIDESNAELERNGLWCDAYRVW